MSSSRLIDVAPEQHGIVGPDPSEEFDHAHVSVTLTARAVIPT